MRDGAEDVRQLEAINVVGTAREGMERVEDAAASGNGVGVGCPGPTVDAGIRVRLNADNFMYSACGVTVGAITCPELAGLNPYATSGGGGGEFREAGNGEEGAVCPD